MTLFMLLSTNRLTFSLGFGFSKDVGADSSLTVIVGGTVLSACIFLIKKKFISILFEGSSFLAFLPFLGSTDFLGPKNSYYLVVSTHFEIRHFKTFS